MKEQLLKDMRGQDFPVGVIGLGYVGLPLAVEMAKAGFKVTGVDLDEKTVDQVNRGLSHIADVPSADVRALVHSGKLQATTDYSRLMTCRAFSICVPTPLTKTKEPDIRYIVAAINELTTVLLHGTLVVLESTTYPGTTDELVAKRINEKFPGEVGKSVFVAFSPERVDPGNEKWQTKNTPKVVGGITTACTEVATEFYSQFIDVVHPVRSAKEAETVKLLENTFRAVNIGLVNEFMLMCRRMDIDIWNVVEAAATKPFGFMPFQPGPGVGGHCIPLDPLYMSWKAKSMDFYNRFIELATDINGNMPRYVVYRISEMLNDDGKCLRDSLILLLGASYKKNVADMRESPSLEIQKLLRRQRANVAVHDPYFASTPLYPGQLGQYDLVVLVTDHDCLDYQRIASGAKRVLDCRNAFEQKGIKKSNVEKL